MADSIDTFYIFKSGDRRLVLQTAAYSHFAYDVHILSAYKKRSFLEALAYKKNKIASIKRTIKSLSSDECVKHSGALQREINTLADWEVAQIVEITINES